MKISVQGVVRRQLGLSFMGETSTEHFILADVYLTGLDRTVSASLPDSRFPVSYPSVSSTGTFGGMHQPHCTSAFHFQLAYVHLTRRIDRLMMRPTERHDDSWWIFAGGKLDHAKLLSSQDEFIKFVHAASGRNDFEIKGIVQVTEYKYVYSKDIKKFE